MNFIRISATLRVVSAEEPGRFILLTSLSTISSPWASTSARIIDLRIPNRLFSRFLSTTSWIRSAITSTGTPSSRAIQPRPLPSTSLRSSQSASPSRFSQSFGGFSSCKFRDKRLDILEAISDRLAEQPFCSSPVPVGLLVDSPDEPFDFFFTLPFLLS